MKKLNRLLKPASSDHTSSQRLTHPHTTKLNPSYHGEPGIHNHHQHHNHHCSSPRDLFSPVIRNSSHRSSYASSTGSTSQLIGNNTKTLNFHPNQHQRFLLDQSSSSSVILAATGTASTLTGGNSDKYKAVPNYA